MSRLIAVNANRRQRELIKEFIPDALLIDDYLEGVGYETHLLLVFADKESALVFDESNRYLIWHVDNYMNDEKMIDMLLKVDVVLRDFVTIMDAQQQMGKRPTQQLSLLGEA